MSGPKFHRPSADSPVTLELREKFWRIVAELYPSTLADLALLLPLVVESDAASANEFGNIVTAGSESFRQRHVRTLNAPLRNWGTKYNLLDSWCIATALDTLTFWKQNGTDDQQFHTKASVIESLSPLSLTIDYNPFTEDREIAENRLRKQLRMLMTIRAEIAKESGLALEATRPHFSDSNIKLCVKYQVGREQYPALRASDVQRVDTVRNAVKGVAKLLDLTLRSPDRPGPRPNAPRSRRRTSS